MPKIESRKLGPTLGFAGLWAVMAIASPDTTFHFGPVIVAGFAPATESRDRLAAGMVGIVVAAIVTLLLLALGSLEGPSLLPWGGAALETVLGTVAGTVAGSMIGHVVSREEPLPA